MSAHIKVWLDDEYEARKDWFSADWVYTRWPQDMINLLRTGTVEEISLDHDLADFDSQIEDRKERTGYDVILWIEEQVKLYGFAPPIISSHSQNSIGRERIMAGAKQIQKIYAEVG